jgi:drug/metabolite transporter superfamily protein YnfA
LTEGFVADLGKSRVAGDGDAAYGLVGTYVESPLRWAISTGKEREDVRDVEGLKGSRVGVSRIGR